MTAAENQPSQGFYLGCKISLITITKIRYEGILYFIENDNVALARGKFYF